MDTQEKLIDDSKDFFVITETDYFMLGGNWERIYLIDKINYTEIYLGELDAVVSIGLISKNNDWAITGREVILFWRNGNIFTIDKPELACIENMECIDDNLVLLTVDSTNLNNNKSVWIFNTTTLELVKQ